MSSPYAAHEKVSYSFQPECRKPCAVSLTGHTGALPCVQGIVGEGGRLLSERPALVGLALLRGVTSHGGEALWCKITSPFMGRGGLFHSQREVRFAPFSLLPQCSFPSVYSGCSN